MQVWKPPQTDGGATGKRAVLYQVRRLPYFRETQDNYLQEFVQESVSSKWKDTHYLDIR